MDEFARAAFRESEAKRIIRRRIFFLHLAIYAMTNVFIFVIWVVTGGGHPWFLYPILGWGIGVVAHGVAAMGLADVNAVVLERDQTRMSTEATQRLDP
jgi:hypothetical protein